MIEMDVRSVCVCVGGALSMSVQLCSIAYPAAAHTEIRVLSLVALDFFFLQVIMILLPFTVPGEWTHSWMNMS